MIKSTSGRQGTTPRSKNDGKAHRSSHKVLVIDVGGTTVKVLAVENERRARFPRVRKVRQKHLHAKLEPLIADQNTAHAHAKMKERSDEKRIDHIDRIVHDSRYRVG